MNELKVKNLILYRIEESHGINRKSFYQEEAATVFNGNILVPNDLEEIQIIKKEVKNEINSISRQQYTN